MDNTINFLEAEILGYKVNVSTIPHFVPNKERSYNWFLFRFQDKILPVGPSFLIIEWTDDNPENESSWRIVPSSPIQNRPDLLKAAGEFVDNFYNDEEAEVRRMEIVTGKNPPSKNSY